MFALCEARLRSFTIASKLALYSLARALRRRKFVQMRAECKLVYILPSAAEFSNIQSFSFSKECRACEVYSKTTVFEDGGVFPRSIGYCNTIG